MLDVCMISPGACVHHETGFGHPERPERLTYLSRYLEDTGLLGDLPQADARPALDEELNGVHPQPYVEHVRRVIEGGEPALDADTTVSRGSLEAAYRSAGAGLTALDMMAKKKFNRFFCSVRPPGHHAEADRAMGFCLFNNVAAAAVYARRKGLADRVLIIDWDVHHGNGTQHIFETSPHVFYYSMHQFPFYPGTGAAHEIGKGEGEGYTLNRPLKAGRKDRDYLKLFEKDLQLIGDRFKPELIIISAGFDAHEADPLGSMQVTTKGFAEMTRMVNALADQYSGGKILSMLEGGYDLKGLAESVSAHVEALGE